MFTFINDYDILQYVYPCRIWPVQYLLNPSNISFTYSCLISSSFILHCTIPKPQNSTSYYLAQQVLHHPFNIMIYILMLPILPHNQFNFDASIILNLFFNGLITKPYANATKIIILIVIVKKLSLSLHNIIL